MKGATIKFAKGEIIEILPNEKAIKGMVKICADNVKANDSFIFGKYFFKTAENEMRPKVDANES